MSDGSITSPAYKFPGSGGHSYELRQQDSIKQGLGRTQKTEEHGASGLNDLVRSKADLASGQRPSLVTGVRV